MLVKGKSFPDDHEFLEIYQFHPFANLVRPYITVHVLCLFPGPIIDSTPFTLQVINWDEKLYGYHFKISPKPLVLLIINAFHKLFLPYHHDTVRYVLPYFSSLSNRSFSPSRFLFVVLLPNTYFFPKAFLSMLNPCDDEYFLTSTRRGFLYFGLVFLL